MLVLDHSAHQRLNRRLPGTRSAPLEHRLILGAATVFVAIGPGIARTEQPLRAELKAPYRVIEGVSVKAGSAIRLQEDAYRQLQSASRIRLTQFPLEGNQTVDLELEQFSVTNPATRFVRGTADGDVPIPHPDVALFRGEVVGEIDSQVFLGISPSGSNGFIRIGQKQYILAPDRGADRADAGLRHVIHERGVAGAGVPTTPFECHTTTAAEPPADGVPVGGGVAGVYPFRVAFVAIECDYDFGQSFDSVNAAAVYVTELLGAVSSLYERDLQVRLYLPYIRVWSTASDPYTGSTVQSLLPEFESYWRANMGFVDRDIAHFLTTKLANGGLAEVDVLCDETWGYGSSSGITGSFPVPLVDGSMGNWDLLIVSHEMGHQFGSPHTHCYTPPIDLCFNTEPGCYSGTIDCSGQGTIMSYCKSCPGDLLNMDLRFGDRVIQRIRQSVDVSCLRSGQDPVYVDWTNNTGIEIGSSFFPYNTVLEGVQVVIPGGTIHIDAGAYPEGIVANRPMILRTTGGSVVIGP